MRAWKTIISALVVIPLTCGAMAVSDFAPDLEIDYLYWGTWNNEILWAQLGLPFPTGSQDTRRNFFLVPEYRSGVRGAATVDLWGSCISLAGRYYFVKYHDSAREVNPGGANLVMPGFTSSDAGSSAAAYHDQPYHSADLFVDLGLYANSCMRFSLQAGGTFAFTKQTIRIDFLDSTNTVLARARSRNRFSGGGPRVGFLTRFSSEWWSLEAEVGLAALMGEQTNVWMQRTSINPVQQDFTLGTGAGTSAHLHLRFGAKFHRNIGSTCAALNVGWEQRNYYNMTAPVSGFVEDAAATSGTVTSFQGMINDVIFGGPYLGISVGF